ncbi:hypothetical protein J4208_04730 [Candidatus Woesearchaeota archaeon]|nr:hypothetical protein [Candidatus Woesearchaeota archaeon]
MRTITYQIQEVSDREAEIQIRAFIEERKKKIVKSFNVLDVYSDLKLPTEQINKIMMKLEREGVVTESE